MKTELKRRSTKNSNKVTFTESAELSSTSSTTHFPKKLEEAKKQLKGVKLP